MPWLPHDHACFLQVHFSHAGLTKKWAEVVKHLVYEIQVFNPGGSSTLEWEAACYGMVKSRSVRLGVKSLLKDLSVDWELRLGTDCSGALGITVRSGPEKPRRMEVCQLRIQDDARMRET